MKNMFTSPNRYVHYDTESTGIDPKVDQVVQICLAETDAELELMKDSQGNELIHMFYMKMRLDVIPNPEAFLVHRTMPSLLLNGTEVDGVYTEIEGFKKINDLLKKTNNTCITGFNNISFDDEMLRYGNLRNMQDPYQHEWANSNHRTDVYHLMMVSRLFSENSIKWPLGDDGKVSLKLEKLSPENGIIHENAHDAESDILATIGLAKIIKDAKPDLYDKFKNLSDKSYVQSLMNANQPLIMTSKYISKDQYSTSIVLPILQDSTNKSKWYVIDLAKDLEFLLNSKVEDIQHQMFTKKEELPERIDVGILNVVANKIPLLSLPPSRNGDMGRGTYMKVAEKVGIDFSVVERNIEILKERFFEVKDKLSKVYSNPPVFDTPANYFEDLYGEFLSREEGSFREQLLYMPPSEGLAGLNIKHTNVFEHVKNFNVNLDKTAEMLLITKWNNFGKELLKEGNYDPNELIVFRNHLKAAYYTEQEGRLNLASMRERISALPEERESEGKPLDEQQLEILKELNEYADHLDVVFNYIDKQCSLQMEKAQEIRNNSPEIYSEFYYFDNKPESDLLLEN